MPWAIQIVALKRWKSSWHGKKDKTRHVFVHNKMKKVAITALALMMVVSISLIVGSPDALQAAKKPTINFLLCPMGCGSLEGNQMLGNIITKKNLVLI